ncbi:Putative uncharacterized protein [Moritella viscosa]|uniref:Uncharacterized protein n=1 Tax=Moritella viscosa TaxID=80854 RepID=A0A1L0B2H8_9GAMM|nr:Putative uncharacterized protein [Moritella viscosa]
MLELSKAKLTIEYFDIIGEVIWSGRECKQLLSAATYIS